MTDMKFSNVHGVINKVDVSLYSTLINTYVDKVSKVKGVKSITQMGSFTAPGLSDIDLIVIVEDDTLPSWESISIKKILENEKGNEVIAHDVFVYPESLADYLDGLFYIDQKNTLYGSQINSRFSKIQRQQLKLLLSFEYTVNRLEILVSLLAAPRVDVRSIMLFISTLRHTYTLLYNFNIISDTHRLEKINEIEDLRATCLDNSSPDLIEELNRWIEPSFSVIFQAIVSLGERLGYKSDTVYEKSYILNFKRLISFEISKESAFNFLLKKNLWNKKFKGKLFFTPMPAVVYQHIRNYKNTKLKNIQDSNVKPIEIRFNLAMAQKGFITRSKYPLAKTYRIVENIEPRMPDMLKWVFLKFISFFKFR